MLKPKKILFVCTEDWFFNSHFLPLAKAAANLKTVAGVDDVEIYLATTPSDKAPIIEKLGVKIIPVNFDRASMGLISSIKLLFSLFGVFLKTRPDIFHFIALKPIVIGGLVARLFPKSAKVYHLTGQGFVTLSDNSRHQKMRRIFFRLITWYLRRPKSWLLLENPDDGYALEQFGSYPTARQSILGGAGVNTEHLRALPHPDNKIVHLGFVGRLVWSQGVDILIEALDILQQRKIAVQLDLYGEPDLENPKTITLEQLAVWNGRKDVSWHGRSENIREVWQKADMAIVPSRGGEGMPRAMLEAASCGRAVIVTDVPGCRHFVVENRQGYIVPVEDAKALADAIEKLVTDKQLRQKMGDAARQRVLDNFTEQHVINDVQTVYSELL